MKRLKNLLKNITDRYSVISDKHNKDIEFLGNRVPAFSLFLLGIFILESITIFFIPFYKKIENVKLIDHYQGQVLLIMLMIYAVSLMLELNKLNFAVGIISLIYIVFIVIASYTLKANIGAGVIICVICHLYIAAYSLTTYKEREQQKIEDKKKK